MATSIFDPSDSSAGAGISRHSVTLPSFRVGNSSEKDVKLSADLSSPFHIDAKAKSAKRSKKAKPCDKVNQKLKNPCAWSVTVSCYLIFI